MSFLVYLTCFCSVISVRLRPSRDCSPIVPRFSALCKGFSQKSEESFSYAIFEAYMAVNYHPPKGRWLLRALRLRLRSLIFKFPPFQAILILTGVSTSPLLYRMLTSTTLLLRMMFNAPLTSALIVFPLAVLYCPLCTLLPLN